MTTRKLTTRNDEGNFVLVAVVLIGSIIVLGQRLLLLSDLPLWFDETWTVVIATQDSWRTFWKAVWLDCNAPLYYLFMAIWTEVAGISNTSLRIPSVLFPALAALSPFLLKAPTLSFPERVTWGATIFMWWPATMFSLDARSYALLLLFSAMQCAVFVKLAQKPDSKNLGAWCIISSISILTHYYAIFLISVQFALIFFFFGKKIIESWRVLIIFTPAIAWIIYHAPRLLLYSDPRYSWYGQLRWEDIFRLLAFPLGPPSLLFGLFLILGLAIVHRIPSRENSQPSTKEASTRFALWLSAIAGLATLGLILLINAFKPFITERYLTIVAPSILLALVLIASAARRQGLGYVFIVITFLTASMTTPAFRADLAARSNYGIEDASDFLAPYRPDQLIFFWDHPNNPMFDQNSLAPVGSFFLQRSNLRPQVISLRTDEKVDPNLRIAALANGKRSAFIWLFETRRKANAARNPPAFDKLPGWTCRSALDRYVVESGSGPMMNSIGSVACVKLANSSTERNIPQIRTPPPE